MLKKYSIIFILCISLFIGCNRQPNIEISTFSNEENEENQSENIVGAWRGDKNSDWKDKSFEFFDDGRLVYTMETGQPWLGRYVILREGQLRADLWDILGINFPTIWDFLVEEDTLLIDFFRNGDYIAFNKFSPGTSEVVDKLNETYLENFHNEPNNPDYLFYVSGCEISFTPIAIFTSKSNTAGMKNAHIAYLTSIEIPGSTNGSISVTVNPCFKANYKGTSETGIPIFATIFSNEGFEYSSLYQEIELPRIVLPLNMKYFYNDFTWDNFVSLDHYITIEIADSVSLDYLSFTDGMGNELKRYNLSNLPIINYHGEISQWDKEELDFIVSNIKEDIFYKDLVDNIQSIPLVIQDNEVEYTIKDVTVDNNQKGNKFLSISIDFNNLNKGYKNQIGNFILMVIDNYGFLTSEFDATEFNEKFFYSKDNDCPSDGLLGPNQTCNAKFEINVPSPSNDYYLFFYYDVKGLDDPVDYQIIRLIETRNSNELLDQSRIKENHISLCDGAPPSNIKIDMKARVTYRDNTPLALRSEPYINKSTFIKDLREGTKFIVLDGPECQSGFLWWKIETKEGAIGWSAEGDEKDFFMEPYDW